MLANRRLPPVAEPPPGVAAAGGAVSVRLTPIRELPSALWREWDALAEDAAEPNAFAERWFAMAGASHLPGAEQVRMLEARAGEVLIGLLPVHVERHDRLPVRYATNWLHPNALLGTPLLRAGHERAAWRAMIEALDGARWAPGYLHVNGLVEDGPVHRALTEAAAELGRTCDTVHRSRRALLESELGAQAYYETTVRKKKRKELKRLQSRLAEQGAVTTRRLTDPGELWAWCDAFLELERSGWKGRAGSALASDAATEAFFRAALAGAQEAGRLELLRMDLDGRAIAMLVNFLTPPGSFSFKIAFDEDYARFSPGVLIQLDNYDILDRRDIDWMDSCAVENHPMIDSLWAERRSLVRVSLPLSGAWRGTQFALVRAAERASAAAKALRRSPSPPATENDDD